MHKLHLGVTADELKRYASVLPGEAEIDEMAVPSYSHWNPLIRGLFWSRLRHALDLLDPRPREVILDFGTGTGVLLPALSARECTVYALDLFPGPAREMVRQRGLSNVTVIDNPNGTRHEFPAGSLDAIVALDVLEHFENRHSVIELFRDRLRPGGRVVVSGPTENAAYRLGRIAAGFRRKGHYHYTDIYRIRSEFERAGFRTARTRRLPAWPLPALFYIHAFRAC
jgi:2-polyprenyl-3-methyl-5-hydroxy-6-metoxy-1,4-benzoquinol methylase